MLFSDAAINKSSSASSNCWISRSIFSEDLPKACFLSLAMRSRRSWINWSCARNVADIFAFSACKAAIIAFRKAGSSGRFWLAFDTSLTVKNQDDPAQLPTVNVRLSSLQGYEALIDARDLEDAA